MTQLSIPVEGAPFARIYFTSRGRSAVGKASTVVCSLNRFYVRNHSGLKALHSSRVNKLVADLYGKEKKLNSHPLANIGHLFINLNYYVGNDAPK